MTSNQGIQLRDYQITAINDIIRSIIEKKNTVLQLPTGTGKTTIIAEVIRLWRAQHSKNQRALVIVHRIELVEQIIERFLQFGITAGKIKAGEPVNTNFQIQVGLIQSLRNQARRPASLGLIIVDEAHHINASSYSDLIAYYDNYKPTVIGVTATPSRLDGKPLGDVFSKLFEYGQISKFISSGFLSPMKHYATGFPELKKIKVKTTGDYDEKTLAVEMSNEKIMANLIKGYEMHAPNKKMIVFAVNTEHAVNIANRYCSSGFSAVSLDYKTDKHIRRQTIEDFKDGKIQILVNVNLFTEGFDCPDVEVIQLARPTKSLNLYLQMVGRGMRIFPGKEFGIILDNAKLWEEHGLVSRERIWTITGLNKSSDKNIKIRLKNDSVEESKRDIEIPQESNQLELIEILDDIIEIASETKYLEEINTTERKVTVDSLVHVPGNKEYRLAKVASELNRSFQVLADLLNQQGFDVTSKPTTKITEEMYQSLLWKLSADKAAKDEIKLLKSNLGLKSMAPEPVFTLAKSSPEDLDGPKILGKIDIGKKINGDSYSVKNRILIKVSLELNSNMRNIALFLKENGYKIKYPTPNSKITEEMYQFLIEKYPKSKK